MTKEVTTKRAGKGFEKLICVVERVGDSKNKGDQNGKESWVRAKKEAKKKEAGKNKSRGGHGKGG